MNDVLYNGGCISFGITDESRHEEMDKWGKETGICVVYAPWHPNPEYRIHKAGTLCCHDSHKFTAGLIIMGEDTIPQPYNNI